MNLEDRIKAAIEEEQSQLDKQITQRRESEFMMFGVDEWRTEEHRMPQRSIVDGQWYDIKTGERHDPEY